MKRNVVILKTTALATLLLVTSNVMAQSKVIPFSMSYTIQQSAQKPESIFYCNPLLLNNKPFNYANFSVGTKGMLTVVAGNPETEKIEKIPLRIYLRRNGKSIHDGASDTTRSLVMIDIASVLAIAKPGDNLVIEPVRKSDVRARRIIKLKDYPFNSDLFSFLRNKQDGC